MKIWNGNMETAAALKKLGRTKEELPIRSQTVAMIVFEPTEKVDYEFLDGLRDLFRAHILSHPEKFSCFIEWNSGTVKRAVFLIANDGEISVIPDKKS